MIIPDLCMCSPQLKLVLSHTLYSFVHILQDQLVEPAFVALLGEIEATREVKVTYGQVSQALCGKDLSLSKSFSISFLKINARRFSYSSQNILHDYYIYLYIANSCDCKACST